MDSQELITCRCLLTPLSSYGQICKDKDEAEVWFVGLKALITRGSYSKWKIDAKSGNTSSDSPNACIRKSSPTVIPFVRSNVFYRPLALY